MLSSNLLNFTVNTTSVDNDQPDGSSEMCGVWHGACVAGIVVFGVAILCTCAKICVESQMVSSRQQRAAQGMFSTSERCEHAESRAEGGVVEIEMSEAVAEIITATQPVAEAVAVGEVVAAIVWSRN